MSLACILTETYHFTHTTLELLAVIAPHDGGVDVGGRVIVGIRQHTNNAHNDALHAVDGSPSHIRSLVGVVLVVSRWMQDRDAYLGLEWLELELELDTQCHA